MVQHTPFSLTYNNTNVGRERNILSTDYFSPQATINSPTDHRPATTALKHSVEILQVIYFSCMV